MWLSTALLHFEFFSGVSTLGFLLLFATIHVCVLSKPVAIVLFELSPLKSVTLLSRTGRFEFLSISLSTVYR